MVGNLLFIAILKSTNIFWFFAGLGFAFIALYKRVAVIKLIPFILKKEQLWANRSCQSLKRVTGVIHFFQNLIDLSLFRSQKKQFKFPTLVLHANLYSSFLQKRANHSFLIKELIAFVLKKVKKQSAHFALASSELRMLQGWASVLFKRTHILAFFCVLYKKNVHSLRSFTFFLKECGVLWVLLHSL